ncbi:helix-turn-helix domain-containing protein [Halobellus sp. EA9]|uniref:helix-turn-helix domain-containing protein n=1 Tax=Halobellus sp. EA9 TaxID=3421647 RepID=UPI003EB7B415
MEFVTAPAGTLAQLARRIESDGSIELDNAFYVEDGVWLESLTIASTEPFDYEAAADSISGISLLYTQELPTTSGGTNVQRGMAFVNEPFPFLLGLVLRQNAVPNRIIWKNGAVHGTVTVEVWEDFRNMADEIEEKFGTFEVRSVVQTDEPGEPLDSGRIADVLISKLSDEMLGVLEAAYTMGYFEVPREQSAKAIADELGIQQSTFSERIRTAENTLLEIVFGARE